MFETKIIAHHDVGLNDLNEIISVKSVAWPYPYEMQVEWLNENLNSSDLHLLLKKDRKTVAYLNLLNIELEINNEGFKSFGIGSVCSAEREKGFGKELMKLANQFIKDNSKPGLLFCKPELVSFYEKFSWAVIERKKLKLAIDNQNFETMFFNMGPNMQLLSYYGRSF